MKKFSEIAKDDIHLAGDKMSLQEVVGKQIIVTGYKITKSKFKKKIHYIETHNTDPQNIVSSVMSYIGWLKHCDSHHLVTKYVFENPVILSKVGYSS